MSEVTVYNLSGQKAGTMVIEPEALCSGISISLLHRAVVSYEANLRQGNACTKTRGDRAGSGKKLWKQKGTGRARMGSIRSPLWRGGGIIFGPKPRDYRMKLSQKERQASRHAILALGARRSCRARRPCLACGARGARVPRRPNVRGNLLDGDDDGRGGGSRRCTLRRNRKQFSPRVGRTKRKL